MTISCYQCMDTGILEFPVSGMRGMTYEYMYQCSCGKGKKYSFLPTLNIKSPEVRENLKILAGRNFERFSQKRGEDDEQKQA